MQLNELLTALFGSDELGSNHGVTVADQAISGTARIGTLSIDVLGTHGPAAIDARLALTLAHGVLTTVQNHPERPILFLVDTSGQALSRHEELLGINGYLAHLAACIDLARRRRHPTISLVYGEAVSGGYLSFGLMADRAFALENAQVRVMDLRAMARVTKIAHERLVALAAASPVFAPGAENYLRMGAIEALWPVPSASLLQAAFRDVQADRQRPDRRSDLGAERGGRTLAAPTAERVRSAGAR